MYSTSDTRPDSLLNFSSASGLPVIMQTEAAECGLACLAMVTGFYGFSTDLATIRRKFTISCHGATLKQIMAIAAKMDLSSRALRLELDQLDQLQLPCILHWEMKHFVVLKKVTRNKITIHDPAVGERVLSNADVANLFTGIALELTPTPGFEKGEDKQKLTFSHFWTRIVGIKRSLLVILVLSLFLQIFAIITPYYMQTVIDDVILRSDLNLLLVLAVGFGLLLMLDTGTSWLRQLVILNLSSRLNIQMAANVFRHLLQLPMDYFAKRHMGDVVSRFGSLNSIRELLTTGMVALAVDGLMALLTLVVMFMYDVRLTFIVIAVVLLYGLMRLVFYAPVRRLNEEGIVSAARENSHFMESVRAIQTIKLFEKESERQSQWQNRLAEAMNKDIRISKWDINFDTANKLLFGFENIVIIYFAALAVTNNMMSVGMLYAFIAYKSRFISSMDNLIIKLIEFRMLELHFDRLADIVYTPTDQLANLSSDQRVTDGQDNSCSVRGEIRAEQIQFSYSEMDPPIFSNVSLHIEAAESLAIVGPSGSGKTTLMKCLMGLLQPKAGNILIDGKPLSQVSDYRKHIAAVMQEDQLLSGTIGDNIACFDSQIDMERVVYCANLACVHDEIMATSMQYNTLVGDMGASLSGGQKQRIILARALYKQPSILFMDEATSHLDINNEMAINNHIKKLSITRVVIAHRPETINMADRVMLLAEGRLTEITAQVKTQ